MPVEQVKEKYQICHKHFYTTCESPETNGKLKFRSLPTLNLPRNICVIYVVCLYVNTCM